MSKKLMALVAAAALAACVGLAGCGGTQAASSSAAAASSSTAAQPASSTAASASSAAAPASSAAAPASSAAAPASSAAASSGVTYIGDAAAKAAALQHAGFTEGDVTALKVELDTDDGTVHYDVDFKQGGMEYEYDIDATTGAVITSKSEVDD